MPRASRGLVHPTMATALGLQHVHYDSTLAVSPNVFQGHSAAACAICGGCSWARVQHTHATFNANARSNRYYAINTSSMFVTLSMASCGQPGARLPAVRLACPAAVRLGESGSPPAAREARETAGQCKL